MRKSLLFFLLLPVFCEAQDAIASHVSGVTIIDTGYFDCVGPFAKLREVGFVDTTKSHIYIDNKVLVFTINESKLDLSSRRNRSFYLPIVELKDTIEFDISKYDFLRGNYIYFSLCSSFGYRHFAVIDNDRIRFYVCWANNCEKIHEVFSLIVPRLKIYHSPAPVKHGD